MGIQIVDPVPGVGKEIKENILGLYKIDNCNDLKPNELILYDKITTKLVENQTSPFQLVRVDSDFFVKLRNSNELLLKVNFSKRPKYYSFTTNIGTPMKNVAQLMGEDCLAFAVDKQCHYFTNGLYCKYCNITPTNLESKIDRISNLNDFRETVCATKDSLWYYCLTGGTFENRDIECQYYTKLGNIIKDELSKNSFSGPFSLSPPNNLDLLNNLCETGVDVISFNPDISKESVFKFLCPGKAKIGLNKYFDAALKAKELWGEGNVVIQYMVGPWETKDELLSQVQKRLNDGILVNLTTFYPSPKSSINFGVTKLNELIEIYLDYSEKIHESGLFPNKRNSILTSESANRSSIANEVVKGYLTRDSYEKDIEIKKIVGELSE
ncbi:MAG: hypothetical protein PHQ98_03535 [Candidatus ainarchaeum sp.]|nr:hypothetical protein [Candidatus ainarchaeum sp.]